MATKATAAQPSTIHAELIDHCMRLQAKELTMNDGVDASGVIITAEEVTKLLPQIQRVVKIVSDDAFVQRCQQEGAPSAEPFRQEFVVGYATRLTEKANGLLARIRGPVLPAPSLQARAAVVPADQRPLASAQLGQPIPALSQERPASFVEPTVPARSRSPINASALSLSASAQSQPAQARDHGTFSFADFDLSAERNPEFRRGHVPEEKRPKFQGIPAVTSNGGPGIADPNFVLPSARPQPALTPALTPAQQQLAQTQPRATAPDLSVSAPISRPVSQPISQPALQQQAPSRSAVVSSPAVQETAASPLTTSRLLVVHKDAAAIQAAQFGAESVVHPAVIEGRTAEEALRNILTVSNGAKLLVIDPYKLPRTAALLHREVGQMIQRVLASGAGNGVARIIFAIPALKTDAARNDIAREITGAVVVKKDNGIATAEELQPARRTPSAAPSAFASLESVRDRSARDRKDSEPPRNAAAARTSDLTTSRFSRSRVLPAEAEQDDAPVSRQSAGMGFPTAFNGLTRSKYSTQPQVRQDRKDGKE